MKMKLMISLVAAAMSVTTTGYAKVFDEARVEASFGYAIEKDDSITPQDIAEAPTSETMVSEKLDLEVNFSLEIGRKTLTLDSLTGSEIFNTIIEDMALNAKRIFESEARSYDGISEMDIWSNTDMTLFIDEINDPCDLLLLSIAK